MTDHSSPASLSSSAYPTTPERISEVPDNLLSPSEAEPCCCPCREPMSPKDREQLHRESLERMIANCERLEPLLTKYLQQHRVNICID